MNFGQSMELLFTVYGEPKSDVPMLIRAYRVALEGVTDAQMAEAVQEYIKTGKWFPKPSELREALEAVQARKRYEFTPQADGVERLWLETKRTSPTLFEAMEVTETAELRAIADDIEAAGRVEAARHLRWRAVGFEAVAEVDRETVAVR